MIGKISIGKSFKGCVNYCMEDKKQELKNEPALTLMKNRAELIHFNKCFGDKNELIKQFNEVLLLNHKLSKPVLHISLSFAPGDVIQKGIINEMVEECARKMGFENNQYIAIYHKDTNHQHVHIIANRVGFDGKTVSDSHNFQKIAQYCRSMEQKYHLKQVLSPRRFLSKKERLIERPDSRKELLKERIKLTIQQSKSYLEFEHRMKQYGYEVIHGRGIAFRDKQKVYSKGSEVGYSLATIERQLYRQLIRKPALTVEQKQFLAQQKELTQELRKDELNPHKKQKPELKNEGIIPERHGQRQRQDSMLDFMKPIEQDDFIPYELRKKKRQKHFR